MANGKKARVLMLLFCDFCGQSQEVCSLLIRGRDEVHICDVCVSRCADMIVEQHRKDQPVAVQAPLVPVEGA